jgi:hypothetical protein
MRDMIRREPRQSRVQLDRIGCRMREIFLALGSHHTDGAEACRAKSHRRPYLAREGGNRRLALVPVTATTRSVRAGEPRRHARQHPPRIGIGDRHRRRRHDHTRQAQHCRRTGRDRLRYVACAIDFHAGQCRE